MTTKETPGMVAEREAIASHKRASALAEYIENCSLEELLDALRMLVLKADLQNGRNPAAPLTEREAAHFVLLGACGTDQQAIEALMATIRLNAYRSPTMALVGFNYPKL
jgi:hypothetical protein